MINIIRKEVGFFLGDGGDDSGMYYILWDSEGEMMGDGR